MSLSARGLLLVSLLGIQASCGGEISAHKPGTPAHWTKRGFQNTNPAFTSPPTWDRIKFIVSRTWDNTFHSRSVRLPMVENDGKFLRDNHTQATVTWIGHSTLLIQLNGVNVLTDPHWSQRASPVSFAGPKRLMPPGLLFEDLPAIDVVLISHNHYDHLDVDTIKRLAATHHPLFIVPLGLKSWFATLGITNVDELDWWESRRLKGLTLTCLPAQHFSSRTLWDRNQTLWGGWAVAGETKKLFFAGDTGYYEAFKEIGSRIGPFDLAAIPIGAYMPPTIMKMTHITPEQALQVFADVRAKRFLGIHWGTFDLTEEPLAEPPQRLEAEVRRMGVDPDNVWIFKDGETRGW
jgi:N-acyl-phosphatidylethanolamine-hydrolysing phospholipase D